MRINTNMAALNAWRNMTSNNSNMQKSLEKLSSGFRINRAADDAAGLAVSEKMRAQIRGTNQSIKNSQDGISLLQTAEGALTEVHSMLQRMRELSVQSSTSTLQDTDRSLLQEEFSQLQAEITRIGTATQFNGRNLLDGSAGVSVAATAGGTNVSGLTATGDTDSVIGLSVTGLNAATTGQVFLGDVNTGTFAGTTDTFTVTQNITVNGKTYSATAGTTTVQQFMDAVNADSATTGASVSLAASGRLQFDTTDVGASKSVTVSVSGVAVTGNGASTTDAGAVTATATDSGADATATIAGHTVVASGSTISVVDGAQKGLSFQVASGVTAGTATLNVGSNGSLEIQTGSQNGQKLNISISDMRSTALGIDSLSIGSQAGAQSSITTLDTAINTVSTQRAKLGALQNRLEYTVSSQSTTAENLSAAESRIRDVDMASEMAQFTKYQILSQASTAMLSQANQSTQGVLSLLR